ncbi:MAG: ThiF family adenylyltransferase, partial [Chloroflexi bacterium]|nr:ThiF family adenylyltransferase [Chloroflexota bacterium]
MQRNEERDRFADEFNLARTVFSDSIITVELSRDAARRSGHVRTFLLAINLLSRTFDNVHAAFPDGIDADRHPWQLGTVDAVVDELVDATDGALSVGHPERSDVVLSIGESASARAERRVMACGSHWQAALDCDVPGAGEGVFGVLYAATLGAAQVLLHTLDLSGAPYEPMAPLRFSLLDLLTDGARGKVVPQLSIPEAHLVGIGAVGSAAIYTLAHLEEMGGTLYLIDNEIVDKSNRQRYVLTRRSDTGEAKVEVAGGALLGSALEVKPFRGAFESFMEDHRAARVDLLLTPVDSEQGRRALARTLPRRIINAATGGTTVTLSTHGFADGKACLHCLYLVEPNQRTPEQIIADDTGLSVDFVRRLVETNEPVGAAVVAQIERHRGEAPGAWSGHIGSSIHSFYAKAVCGDAKIQLPTGNVIAPLPFISAAAGILLAAELAKMSHMDLTIHRLDNYFRADTLRV